MSSCENLRKYYIKTVLQSLALSRIPTYQDIRKITKDADVLYKACDKARREEDNELFYRYKY